MADKKHKTDIPLCGNDISVNVDTILVLDFGSQYSHLIIRRFREFNVHSELLPCTTNIENLGWKPKGIVLSGSPYSVYSEDAPHVEPCIFKLGIPILGICYGLQEISWHNGKCVFVCEKREYGHAVLKILETSKSLLFDGLDKTQEVWMSHGDALSTIPNEFHVIGETANSPYAAIAHENMNIFGLQFHPEVTHTKCGVEILKNFALKICKCRQNWTMQFFIDNEISRIRHIVGNDHVIGAVSGGVDSTVAAKILERAIGDQFHAIYVDNGMMRLNESSQIVETLSTCLGVNLSVVDASSEFFDKLLSIDDPEDKRRIIGNTFIHIFERETKKIDSKLENKIKFLVQGTLYPDVIESVSFKGPSQVIKTHHNVGGLLKDMRFKLLEPLRELFKDEVRILGKLLGIHDDLIWRHPFPGPGLAVRVIGEITPEKINIVRQADFIFIDEIKKAGIYKEISQAFAVLLPMKTVGVMGDKRTYEHVVALRAITTIDFMTADIYNFDMKFLKSVSGRITNEVKGVNRVVYDISTKPPATIEWE
ncbi:hypothetical protein PORY_001532 [Pneumocystis oryctolagi]|uniref:Uncharacterized protein n=1 Tax=Pneumocystis oryctolagi TaxID=42067 RepID=A0ACB7CE54_9ASCO|nr:hypothetical protein PORY_001532 [Pneumocystis oryctolagi]